jgi:superfamily II DNA or RNA helicase
MTKNQIQQQIVKDLIASKSDYNLLLLPTGVGKTKIAIDYISKLFLCEEEYLPFNPADVKILIVVPTEQLRDVDWPKELKKWKVDKDVNIELICYASLPKLKDQEFNLVILDELHKLTEFNSSFLENNTVHKALGLTATYPRDKMKQYLLDVYQFNIVVNMSLDEAVSKKLVSPYEITIIPVELDRVTKNIQGGNKFKPFMTTEYSQYQYLTRVIDEIATQIALSHHAHPGLRTRLKHLRLQRARFLGTCESKLKAGMSLYLKHMYVNHERTLIFCNSIDSARLMCANTYHSKTNSDSLNAFREGKIDTLSCVNALNEGVNLNNVDNAIIIQVNTSDLNLIQKIGRTLRLSETKTRPSKIYIFCMQDTIDVEWVNKVTKDLNVI